MKFIEIKPGINISGDGNICVETIDMMKCKITTPMGTYESIYPSWRILMLFQEADIKEQLVAPQTPDDKVNLWGRQHFAG